MNIHPENLLTIPPLTAEDEVDLSAQFQAQKPSFQSEEEMTALIAFGGTIQSAYIPDQETIAPVMMNPSFERINELHEHFHLAPQQITGTVFLAKDSRHITDRDMIRLIHALQWIKNKKIMLTCGTYMLPLITQIIDHHFGDGRSDKLIGVTGSMLPLSQEAQDADFNVGGTFGALEAFDAAGQTGLVFAYFHGHVFCGDKLNGLDLHSQSLQPRFGRKTIGLF